MREVCVCVWERVKIMARINSRTYSALMLRVVYIMLAYITIPCTLWSNEHKHTYHTRHPPTHTHTTPEHIRDILNYIHTKYTLVAGIDVNCALVLR